MKTIETNTVLRVETCCRCGVQFAFPEGLFRDLQENGKTFYCPNGHAQAYSERYSSRLEKEVEKLRTQLKNASDSVEFYRGEANTKAMELKATRARLTRTEKRLSNGVCPCCNRQFVNLSNHMHRQHPDYVSHEN